MGNKIFQGFMAFLGVILLMLFIALFARIVYREYSGENYPKYDKELVCHCDTTCAPTCLTLMTMFDNSQDVLVAQSDLQKEVEYIDQFRDMPSPILANVTTMLFKRRQSVTIEDIVNEYNANQQVYDNLKPEAIQVKLDKKPAPVAETQSVSTDSSNSNPSNNGK